MWAAKDLSGERGGQDSSRRRGPLLGQVSQDSRLVVLQVGSIEQQCQRPLGFARLVNSGRHHPIPPALNSKLRGPEIPVHEPCRGPWLYSSLRTTALDFGGQFLTAWWGSPLFPSMSPLSLLLYAVEDGKPRPPSPYPQPCAAETQSKPLSPNAHTFWTPTFHSWGDSSKVLCLSWNKDAL